MSTRADRGHHGRCSHHEVFLRSESNNSTDVRFVEPNADLLSPRTIVVSLTFTEFKLNA
jgi:hypothetical protein